MRLLSNLCLMLSVVLAACGGRVVVEGEPAGEGGPGSVSPDQLGDACLEACAGLEAPCESNTDCTRLCALMAATSAVSDVCATATAATIECLDQVTPESGCSQTCSDDALPFSDCLVSWCSQEPEKCAELTGSGS